MHAVVQTHKSKVVVNNYLEKIKDCVLSFLGNDEISIASFGSMADGTDRGGSDVDIAIIPRGTWSRSKVTLLKERLEELSVPYKVDIVDFSKVSDDFRFTALRSSVWRKQQSIQEKTAEEIFKTLHLHRIAGGHPETESKPLTGSESFWFSEVQEN
jgi:predicted nucleotidyltransferase